MVDRTSKVTVHRWRMTFLIFLVASIVLVIAWPLSIYFGVVYDVMGGSDVINMFGVGWGSLYVQYMAPAGSGGRSSGWHGGWLESGSTWWLPRFNRYAGGWYASAPLWIPLVIVLVLAACFRPRPSVLRDCKVCGYNLTGNVSGVCPECGSDRTAIDDSAETGNDHDS